ncbi:MAG: ABC transporter ATP-binding protein [Candidatus Omnitrophica bacterium]|nr:ABC transporter ATP-binding protein [Candidatus Omnitrophota bacterium]
MPQGAVGLLGPNGAGKSTLLKTMMGFLKPDKGQIKVLGRDPRREGAQVRQRIGYMPEEDTYMPGMTAVEFVSYCGMLCGLPRNEAMLRAHQALHYCGLGEARYRTVDTYSTGMRQRIKLAQALVHDPDLLFLDEPTNGLDPQGRKSMLDLIQEITRQKNISVILSSHLLHDVETVCDYVLVLFQGSVAASGRIQDLKQMAQSSYIIRIKGDMETFIDALREQGLECQPSRDSRIQVRMKEKLGTDVIFRIAHESGAQIRHMAKEEMTLKEVFASAIQQSNGDAAASEG